jgi:hypothetical protein
MLLFFYVIDCEDLNNNCLLQSSCCSFFMWGKQQSFRSGSIRFVSVSPLFYLHAHVLRPEETKPFLICVAGHGNVLN